MHVLGRSPEIGKGSRRKVRRAIENHQVANGCIVGTFSETMDRNIESKINIDVMLPRHEQKGVAVVAELPVERRYLATLSRVDLIKNYLGLFFISWRENLYF